MPNYYPAPAAELDTLQVDGVANVDGNFSVATSKFTVAAASGNTAVAGTLGVAGNFAVATDKFTVAAATGNTVIAGTLSVTGIATLKAGFSVPLANAVSPAQITGHQNNYAPGIAGKMVLNIYGDGDYNITGLAGGVDGQFLLVNNVGGLHTFTLKFASGSSSAGNQFVTPGAGDYVIRGYASVWLYYNAGAGNYWQVIGA